MALRVAIGKYVFFVSMGKRGGPMGPLDDVAEEEEDELLPLMLAEFGWSTARPLPFKADPDATAGAVGVPKLALGPVRTT